MTVKDLGGAEGGRAGRQVHVAVVGAEDVAAIARALAMDGTFHVVNQFLNSDFPAWASEPGAHALAGDFDGDGRADIALTGVSTWQSIPVAFSNGDGTFRVVNQLPLDDFPAWASEPGAHAVVGDFDGDGRADIALTGVSGWQSVPVAFSNGDGTFRIMNKLLDSDFPTWATVATPVSGIFR